MSSNLNTSISNELPQHVAIIMDGNNRWAEQRKLLRTQGHLAGTKTVKTILTHATCLGIRYLTLYAFSFENWKRPAWEVNSLMKIFVQKINEELPSLHKNQVHLRVIGDLSLLPTKTREKLDFATKSTQNNPGIQLILAISYGSRQEIVQTCKIIAKKIKQNEMLISDINEDSFAQHLNTADTPDPELLIRAGGLHRLSNYLLWQIAYSEIYVTPTLWPDFNEKDFDKAISFYQNTERKFGNSTKAP